MEFFLIQTRDINDSKNVMRFLKNTFIEISDDNKSGKQSALNVLKETDLRNEIKKTNYLINQFVFGKLQCTAYFPFFVCV